MSANGASPSLPTEKMSSSSGPNFSANVESLEKDLVRHNDKLIRLEVALRNYNVEMEKAEKLHQECLNLYQSLEKNNTELANKCTESLKTAATSQDAMKLDSHSRSIHNIRQRLKAIQYHIPMPTGSYLRAIIGPISLVLPTRDAKFEYKNSYENLKLIHSIIMACMSLVLIFVKVKVLDYFYNMHIIWYYCTLTIRERILKINGSNIRKWWFAHHMLSVINSAILLTWSYDSQSYKSFRPYMMSFSLYLACVSFMQFYYQKGCLYRLYSLGYSKNKMDVTVDGFVSFMWKGLGFLIPFLILSYLCELGLTYRLIKIYIDPLKCQEWQPLIISIILGAMSIGNLVTVAIVIKRKMSTSQDWKDISFSHYWGIEKLLETSASLSRLYSTFSNNLNYAPPSNNPNQNYNYNARRQNEHRE